MAKQAKRDYKKGVTITAPVHVTMHAQDDDTLAVCLDDEHFDLMAPPVGCEEEVLALIEAHGREWCSYAPDEWEAHF